MIPLQPSEIAGYPHEWDELRCSDCREVLGHVASFDANRAPGVVLCKHCSAWRTLKCSRCSALLGSASTSHRAPVIYCASCMSADEEAAKKRLDREAVENAMTQEPDAAAIARPGAITEADSAADSPPAAESVKTTPRRRIRVRRVGSMLEWGTPLAKWVAGYPGGAVAIARKLGATLPSVHNWTSGAHRPIGRYVAGLVQLGAPGLDLGEPRPRGVRNLYTSDRRQSQRGRDEGGES